MSTVQNIVRDAQTTLQDDGERWPAKELVGYVDDALKAILTYRPELFAVEEDYTPVPGARQVLPPEVARLLDVPCNATGSMRAITLADETLLRASRSKWRTATQGEFLHFTLTISEPRVFNLYPPPGPNPLPVRVLVARYPAPLPEPTTTDHSGVTGELPILPEWAISIYHYVLFRAYSKDAEFASNAAMAANHFQIFNTTLNPA